MRLLVGGNARYASFAMAATVDLGTNVPESRNNGAKVYCEDHFTVQAFAQLRCTSP
jgi:hypothetical protein